MLADILGVPTEHIWVACGDSSCATEPQPPPHSGVFLLFPPSPSLTPVTSCCLQHLGKVGANGCPCSGIPSTLHPVRRGGNLGTGIRPAVQPRGPRLASCPLPEPGLPGRSPCVPLGSLCLAYCPHTPSLYSTTHPWDRAGDRSGALPHIPCPPGIALSSRGIPGCPRAQAHAACQLLALLKGIFWSKGTIVGTLGCPRGVH